MTDLAASVVIESSQKRKAKSRRGRMLQYYRDQLACELKAEVREKKFLVPSAKVGTIKQLNDRINRIFTREDEKLQLNLFMEQRDIMTEDRTVVEFKQYGDIIQAKFIGTIAEMKLSLRKNRGVVKILWCHYKKDEGEQIIRGMWMEMDVRLHRIKVDQD
jgi:hypothetical protein